MVEEEIVKLGILVDVVLNRIKREAKEGSYKTVSELLWHVPTQILQSYIKED